MIRSLIFKVLAVPFGQLAYDSILSPLLSMLFFNFSFPSLYLPGKSGCRRKDAGDEICLPDIVQPASGAAELLCDRDTHRVFREEGEEDQQKPEIKQPLQKSCLLYTSDAADD